MSTIQAVRSTVSVRQVAADYLSLTKPTIVGLLVATALAAMVAAAHGRPHLLAMLAVILGGRLPPGSAPAAHLRDDRSNHPQKSRTPPAPPPRPPIPGWRATGLGLPMNAFAVGL